MTMQSVSDGQSSVCGGSNKQLSFLLAGYGNSAGRPGHVGDKVTQLMTLAAIRKRARFVARLRGVSDPEVAEEAMSAMFDWMATSRFAEQFRPDKGTMRQYVNKILARFVGEEIRKRWTKSLSPLPDDAEAKGVGPATAAEVHDLGAVLRRRLDEDFGTPSAKGSPDKPDEPPGRIYVRRHRARKRQWKRVADLFPGRKLKPPKHQWN